MNEEVKKKKGSRVIGLVEAEENGGREQGLNTWRGERKRE